MKKAIEKADILIEALPYIKKFQHKVVVVKCGGRQLLNNVVINNILQDIVFMNCVGLNPIFIHGGGPSISQRLQRIGKVIEFHRINRAYRVKSVRLRVTSRYGHRVRRRAFCHLPEI